MTLSATDAVQRQNNVSSERLRIETSLSRKLFRKVSMFCAMMFESWADWRFSYDKFDRLSSAKYLILGLFDELINLANKSITFSLNYGWSNFPI
jgi:hypothetical protein